MTEDKLSHSYILKVGYNRAISHAVKVVENQRSIEVPSGTTYAILTNLIESLKKLKR